MFYTQVKDLTSGDRELRFAEVYTDFNLDRALQSSRLWGKQARHDR